MTDGLGRVYVTGFTTSDNFPLLGAYQTTLRFYDVFVTVLDTTTTGNASLAYSTYLGGANLDTSWGIATGSKRL